MSAFIASSSKCSSASLRVCVSTTKSSSRLISSTRRATRPRRSSIELSSSTRRRNSTLAPARPFTYHIGASFLGKPVENDEVVLQSTPFPDTHPVVGFRDKMLSWRREIPSDTAGQDFFLVQEVSLFSELVHVIGLLGRLLCA